MENVNIIFCLHLFLFQLTKLEEKGRVKCAQYWPESNITSIKDFVITTTDSHEFPDHVVRTFNITRTGQSVEKVIKQFHFTSWPDFGVPVDPSGLLSFLRKVNNWKLSQVPAVSLHIIPSRLLLFVLKTHYHFFDIFLCFHVHLIFSQYFDIFMKFEGFFPF